MITRALAILARGVFDAAISVVADLIHRRQNFVQPLIAVQCLLSLKRGAAEEELNSHLRWRTVAVSDIIFANTPSP